MSATLINVSCASMVLAFFSYASYAASSKKILGTVSTLIFQVSFIFLTWFFIDRWIEAKRAPLSNMHESLIAMAWIASAIYIVLEQVYQVRKLGLVMAMTNVAIIVTATMFDDSVAMLVPALQSYWLKVHVLTVMSGYAAFTVAFAASVYYLLARYRARRQALSAGSDANQIAEAIKGVQIYQDFSTAAMRFGFFVLIVGIFLGGVWAQEAWGRFWGWDPKETWALITWIVYLFGLHVKYVPNRLGIKDMNLFFAGVAIVGYIVTLWCYFGVNLLISGLHSYA